VELLTGFINHLKHIRLYNNKFLVFLYKEQWVILIDDKVRSIKDVGMQLYDALSTYFNSSHFIMGISDLHRYWDLRRAYNEAVFTLNYVRNRQDSVSLLIYGELGIIKLFTDSNGNINDAYLDELYQLYLRPILEYDRKHSSNLYFTLESFFSNELSYKLTSEKLFIHVNTLHARISKIEHLIHVSFSNLDSIIGLRLTILLNQFDYFSHYKSCPT
jgi:DNA-binding PucR family transcriptional regulator